MAEQQATATTTETKAEDATPPTTETTPTEPTTTADESSKDKQEQTVVEEEDPELERRYRLCMEVGEEVVKGEELKALLKAKESPRCYDGFEPSGRVHIAQGLMKAANVNRLTEAGCSFTFWVADWFAMLNSKMGGNLARIQTVGKYMIEVWKASGMNMEKVEFLWSSEHINARAAEYWPLVMDIAREFNVKRVMRCGQIMGREEGAEMPAAQILYPCMQCADIFFLKADICQLGLDQRKVNMLAREYCDAKKMRFKPVVISHHMLMGLQQGQEKMSKSKPDSAIFMEDSVQEVNTKIKKAFCPPGVVEANPCLDYAKHVVFGSKKDLPVTRKPENGGDITYTTYEQLESDYKEGKLHPGDLKPALSRAINALLEPVREHFKTNSEAKKLLNQVKKMKTTR